MFRFVMFGLAPAALLAVCFPPGIAKAVQVVYTFEQPDTGQSVTDRALDDGAQDAVSWNDTGAVDTDPANAAFGSQSGYFPGPNSSGQPGRWIDTGVTELGSQFTLAAMINDPDFTTQFRRVFASYTGGSIDNDNLIVGHYAGTGILFRTGAGDLAAALPGTFADPGYHHLAVTYDAGSVSMYADGVPFGGGVLADIGPLTLSPSLRFGDDAPPADGGDEQFVGHADDIVIWDRALSAAQIDSLYRKGAWQTLIIPEPSGVMLLLFGAVCVMITLRRRVKSLL